jgi:hypothetical protein
MNASSGLLDEFALYDEVLTLSASRRITWLPPGSLWHLRHFQWSGNQITFSWSGGGLLQQNDTATNANTWTDVNGGNQPDRCNDRAGHEVFRSKTEQLLVSASAPGATGISKHIRPAPQSARAAAPPLRLKAATLRLRKTTSLPPPTPHLMMKTITSP